MAIQSPLSGALSAPALIWRDGGWTYPPLRLPPPDLVKKKTKPQANLCNAPISAHFSDWQDKKTKNTEVGGGDKVARQAYSSIFHTRARAPDLVSACVCVWRGPSLTERSSCASAGADSSRLLWRD